MKGFGVEERVLFLENTIGEVEANTLYGCQPGFDNEQVVISGGGFVAEPAFDHWENDVLFLPFEKSCAELTKEFAASGFEEVEVTRVIDVVAQRTLGIGYAM